MATVAVTFPKPTLPKPPRRRPVSTLAAGRASSPEVYFKKDIDNSRLVVRQVGLEKLREYFNLVALGILVFSFLLVFSWQHLKCVQYGYEIQGLKTQRHELQESNRQLRLSEAALANPQRIDTLARKIGMVSPSPQQVIQCGGVDAPSGQQGESAQYASNSPAVVRR